MRCLVLVFLGLLGCARQSSSPQPGRGPRRKRRTSVTRSLTIGSNTLKIRTQSWCLRSTAERFRSIPEHGREIPEHARARRAVSRSEKCMPADPVQHRISVVNDRQARASVLRTSTRVRVPIRDGRAEPSDSLAFWREGRADLCASRAVNQPKDGLVYEDEWLRIRLATPTPRAPEIAGLLPPAVLLTNGSVLFTNGSGSSIRLTARPDACVAGRGARVPGHARQPACAPPPGRSPPPRPAWLRAPRCPTGRRRERAHLPSHRPPGRQRSAGRQRSSRPDFLGYDAWIALTCA